MSLLVDLILEQVVADANLDAIFRKRQGQSCKMECTEIMEVEEETSEIETSLIAANVG